MNSPWFYVAGGYVALSIAIAKQDQDAGGAFLILGILLLFYFFPTIIACIRKHNQRLAIFMMNLLLGWTCIIWVAGVIWACTNDTE